MNSESILEGVATAHHKFLLKGVLFLKHALMIPSDEALEMSRPLSRRCRRHRRPVGIPTKKRSFLRQSNLEFRFSAPLNPRLERHRGGHSTAYGTGPSRLAPSGCLAG